MGTKYSNDSCVFCLWYDKCAKSNVKKIYPLSVTFYFVLDGIFDINLVSLSMNLGKDELS